MWPVWFLIDVVSVFSSTGTKPSWTLFFLVSGLLSQMGCLMQVCFFRVMCGNPGWRLTAEITMLRGLKMSPFSKIRTLEEVPAASNPISRLGAGHQNLGDGGGLRAEPSPRNTVNAFPSLCTPWSDFLCFQAFLRSHTGIKIPTPKNKNKSYAVYLPQTPNPEVRVSPGWLMSLQPGKNFKGSVWLRYISGWQLCCTGLF